MSDSREQTYFDLFDPVTSEMPVPSTGIFECGVRTVSVSIRWYPAIEAALRRLEFHDAWEGTEEQKQFAVDQIGYLLEALIEGEI